MLFSSPLFLFLFLPVVLAGYALTSALGRRVSNLWLLFASILFYAWGEKAYTLVMLASMLMNFAFGLLVERARGRRRVEAWALGAAVGSNLLLLGYFKYQNFVVDNLNALLSGVGIGPLANEPVHLPIGISFFTFHALSYVIDVRRAKAPVQRNPLRLMLYLSLFPQLVAGPIIRYGDVAAQLLERRVTLGDFEYGCLRFVSGLAKKVLIANTVAELADYAFELPVGHLTTSVAWLGAFAYTLQIYFDFSGYSDMAIGLGRMLGFHFKENFEHPYGARSIREFWRRWHISLSSFFRDYLYIPLGGNQRGALRTHLNLIVAFVLCGLWHGARWTFLVWGAYHGLFLVLERTRVGRFIERSPGPMRLGYALLVVMVGWVFFRAETLAQAVHVLSSMAGRGGEALPDAWLALHLNLELLTAVVVGAVLSFPVARRLPALGASSGPPWLRNTFRAMLGAGTLALFAACSARLASGTYNPFIYFQF